MIPASVIVKALEGLGFTLQEETDAERLYGKPGQAERLALPKLDSLDYMQAVTPLREAGISDDTIAEIVGPYIESAV